MVEYVRSDYRIELKIRTSEGETIAVGTHTREGDVNTLEDGLPVSHLHRLDPSGRVLASFDADRARLQLRPLDRDLAVAHDVEIRGMSGIVTQLRWRGDGRGFVVVTTDNAWLVPYDLATAPAIAEAQPVFHAATHGRARVLDTRMMKQGFIAETMRTIGVGDWPLERREIWFVRVDDDTIQDVELLNPDDEIQIANLRSDDRIVMVVDEPYDQASEGPRQRLVTLRPRVDGPAERIESTNCASDDWCQVVNWTPDTQRLGYATMSGDVVLAAKSAEGAPLVLPIMSMEEEEAYDHWVGSIHTLWANAGEDRIVAANDVRVRSWDADGGVAWTWNARRGTKVRSAQFDTDGRAVLAAVDRRIVRIADGRARTLVRERLPKASRGPERAPNGESEWSRSVYIDDVTPLALGNGGSAVAYMLVELHTRHADWDEVTRAHPELGSGDDDGGADEG
ncbi:MAG TPA: hypothetical protein VFG69_11580 [Nannocystaceae bacterium]|nr:hypothetical protein [Nannocystaceae bacterium]